MCRNSQSAVSSQVSLRSRALALFNVNDASGTPGGTAPAGFPRYQYAGGWGYESDLISLPGANSSLSPITLQHLGWRWYDPALGRLVQRDPIGLAGGLDVYVYAFGNPLVDLDPDGRLSLAQVFLNLTGGPRNTYLDRLGNRLAARSCPAGTPSAGGLVAAGRVPKSVRLPGQARTKSIWRSILVRAGKGALGKAASRAGLAGLAIGCVCDLYAIGQEAIYAAYDIPPGVY